MKKSTIEDSIECLLQYAVDTGLIEETDRIQKRNEIAALLGVKLPTSNRAPNNAIQKNGLNQVSLDDSDSDSQNTVNTHDMYNTHYDDELHKTHNIGNTKHHNLSEILGSIADYAAKTGIIPRNTITYRDLFDTKVMGLLTPRQSEVIRRFTEIRNRQSIEKATEYFYSMCQASNYIRTDKVRKNRSWRTPTEFGELAITINLSKPEKDPRDIAEAAAAEHSQYPKCVLCVENVGYAGTTSHPARQNLRVIPLTLGNEPWYFQYSPYVYYNEHCIILSEEHRPLVVDSGALNRMLDFVDAFPHYFVGSNAGLPIVGGSILNHDHYQGGRETFPMDRAPFNHIMVHPGYPSITASTLKWYMSTIRLVGNDRQNLLGLASLIMNKWHDYKDESGGIVPYTLKPYDLNGINGTANDTTQASQLDSPSKTGMPHEAGEYVKTGRGKEHTGKPAETPNTLRNGVPQIIRHNAITPTVRKDAQGNYIINLVLRNNRTTQSRPHGLFHPRPKLHHIKKENIGVIEVLGMAILPGRLYKELEEISKILCGEVPVPALNSQNMFENTKQNNENNILYKHRHWISELVNKHGNHLSTGQAQEILKAEVGNRFAKVLLDASVFKQDAKGQAAFQRFINTCGFA